jgi:hypothetical protein
METQTGTLPALALVAFLAASGGAFAETPDRSGKDHRRRNTR